MRANCLINICLVAIVLLCSSCGLTHEMGVAQSQNNIRAVFRIPKDVPFQTFDCEPGVVTVDDANWAVAEVQFDDQRFAEYLAKTNDKNNWGAVSWRGYGPDIEDESTEKSLTWSDLPVPEDILKAVESYTLGYHFKGNSFTAREKQLIAYTDAIKAAKHGKYYCWIFENAVKDEKRHLAKTVRKHPSETKNLVGRGSGYTIFFVFGLLDSDTKKLYTLAFH